MYRDKSTKYELYLRMSVQSKLELLRYDMNKEDHYKITIRH